jgi:ABC-type Fe3+-siderophore transport system permease subunit
MTNPRLSRTLTIIAAVFEAGFAVFHLYMQRVIYKPLHEAEMRKRNPRGAALLYISLVHLINNAWSLVVLLSFKLPVWMIVIRLVNCLAIVGVIDNYLRQYTGMTILEKIGWTKEKPNER